MTDIQEMNEAIEKGELDKAHLAIGWKASEWGYDVEVLDDDEASVIYEYHAGNSPWDSQQSVALDKATSESKLREWALQTAKEIADELDLPQSVIFEEEEND